MASEVQIRVGGVPIGGGAPVVVQSMTLTKTHDVEATTAQIAALASAGCEIVRVAVPKSEDADALAADRAALADPGDRRHPLQRLARAPGDRRRRRGRAHQPGQHRRARQDRAGRPRGEAGRDPDADRRERRLAARAPRRSSPARTPPRRSSSRRSSRSSSSSGSDYRDFKISVKASHVPTMIRAYRMLADEGALPAPPRRDRGRHAVRRRDQERGRHGRAARWTGSATPSASRSPPTRCREVEVAWEILKALGLRERGPVMIACPSCGRDNVGVESLAVVVEERLKAYPQAFEVAVMGCAVNGPGRGRGRRLRDRRRARRRLHLRPRPRAQEGLVGDADRRALRRDRPLDRGRHGPARASEDGEARRARDGRGEPDPARLSEPSYRSLARASAAHIARTGNDRPRARRGSTSLRSCSSGRPSSSSRPCARRRPTRRPSRTSCSCGPG